MLKFITPTREFIEDHKFAIEQMKDFCDTTIEALWYNRIISRALSIMVYQFGGNIQLDCALDDIAPKHAISIGMSGNIELVRKDTGNFCSSHVVSIEEIKQLIIDAHAAAVANDVETLVSLFSSSECENIVDGLTTKID